jgi:hypothetical protein
MAAFLNSVLIAILILSIGMVLIPLAFPDIPSFPGELVASYLTWSHQQHQSLRSPILKFVGIGIQVVCACIGAVAFFVGGLQADLTAIYETGFCCLKFRSALKKLSVDAAGRIPIRHLVKQYEEIRIMNTIFNSLYEDRFYIVLIGLGQLSGIVGFCATINLWSKLPLPVYGIMVFINLLKFVAIMFFLTVGSTVWIESRVLLEAMKVRYLRSSNKRLHKRLIATLPTLKVKVGSVNFIERMTPCIVISFMIEQAISLILLSQ